MTSEPIKVETINARAIELAMTLKNPTYNTEHLLLAMLDICSDARKISKDAGLLWEDFKSLIVKDLSKMAVLDDRFDSWRMIVAEKNQGTITPEQFQKEFNIHSKLLTYHPRVKNIMNAAAVTSLTNRRHTIYWFDLYYAILSDAVSPSVKMLIECGMDIDFMKACLQKIKEAEHLYNEAKEQTDATINRSRPEDDRKENENILKQYTKELVSMYRDNTLEPTIGREEEIERMCLVLGRKNKPNVALIGPAGTGKSAIVYGLAQRIANQTVPESISQVKIFELDVTNLTAGTRFRGDFEEKVRNLLNELKNIPNAVLFIDELHTIKGTGTGSDNSLDFSNMLKPALARDGLRLIGCTTDEEYKKFIEKDKALARRFYKLSVMEPDHETTINILQGLIPSYESYHGVTYHPDCAERAVTLSAKYIHSKCLPDKAIDLLDMSGARKKTFAPGESVTVEDIINEVAKLANVRPQEMKKEKTFDWKLMTQQVKSQVMGQDEAIEKIMEKIVMHRAGLSDPTKPILSALFQGSSGCGKTETTIQLSRQLDMPLVRFDMSEYQEKHSVSKFIGAPPGYVGYEEGNDGALINAVEKNPSCILLLDEVEKAHPDVLKILLQVLDYGTLTSSKDKQANFRNCIVIMTTNLGAQDAEMKKSIGFLRESENEKQETVDKAVNEFFAPEFRNRIDLIIKFNKLGRDILEQVTDKFLTELNQQLYAKNMDISLTEKAKQRIIDLAQEQNLGARPVKRLIDQHLRVPLGYMIVDNPDAQAKSITVDFVEDEFKFKFQQSKSLEKFNENLQTVE